MRPIVLTCCLLAAQSARPQFEVASVTENTTRGRFDPIPRRTGDRIVMHNTPLANIVDYAYGVEHIQVVGNLEMPHWFDIEAKADPSASDAGVRLMFQGLLEDRFRLRAHREARKMTVYHLLIAKGGLKMKPAGADSLAKAFGGVYLESDGPHLQGIGAGMEQLRQSLSLPAAMNALIVDLTGLTGAYDYDVPFSRMDQPDDSGRALPAALEAALGLKLERASEPVEMLVIDHVEPPSRN